MTAAGVSPSSSPRLPSPPPLTEVQIGPQSPSVGESFGSDADLQLLGVSLSADDGPTRRIRPGSKANEMSAGPPLIPLSQLDSPFQLQEHLKALYNHHTRPEGTDTVYPIQREVARQLAEPPEGVEKSLWLYELCRFLTMKANNLIIAFFAESPPCSSQTCPEMRASEWQYLCAVHDPPKACCAIDYCCHTLDWATNILTSPKHFPSRLTLGSDSGGGAQAGMRHLTNVFRRLYRIFAHAWFQHRDVFWQVEGHDGLYMFFKTVCDMYNLIPSDNYTIPPEAEGDEAHQPQQVQDHGDLRRLTILRKDNEPLLPPLDQVEPATISTGATTRRHKSSPSIGSRVTTINESAEDAEEPAQMASSEVKEPSQVPTEAASDAASILVQSPQSTESQVTVAEVELEDEAPSTNEVPTVEETKVQQESNLPEPAVEEATATATEETTPEEATSVKPELEPQAAEVTEATEATEATEPAPEPAPEPAKPELELEPDKKPDSKETAEEPAKET
ncbi:Mob1/phocein [Aspergillus granulosus]|uniref:Mob1/phocein n=1 Tax=Aspergillus granulosus TaxID=176169 RepID=A0ABR4H056_9EURO